MLATIIQREKRILVQRCIRHVGGFRISHNIESRIMQFIRCKAIYINGAQCERRKGHKGKHAAVINQEYIEWSTACEEPKKPKKPKKK